MPPSARLAGERPARPSPRSTTSRVAAGLVDDARRSSRRGRRRWRTRPSRPPLSCDVARAAARSRAGRCSAAGSGATSTRVAADRAREVADWVVVATTSSPCRPTGAPQPDPPARAASAPRLAAARARRRARQARERARERADARTRRPASTAIVAPGGAFVSTDSQSPATPSSARARRSRPASGAGRLDHRRVVAAGTTSSAVASSAPTTDSAATAASATSAEQDGVEQRERRPERAARPSGSKPRASQRRPSDERRGQSASAAAAPASAMSPPPISSRLPNSSVSTFDAGVEDVAGEDHAGGEAPTSTSAVRLS